MKYLGIDLEQGQWLKQAPTAARTPGLGNKGS
jgi:hypothetical protein